MLTSSPSANTFSSADPGFAALSVDEVLAANADIVSRIKLCYGTDRDTFVTDVLALIRQYAAYVHLLPATADNYFSAPGGLLRLGLEAGFFSLQGTDAHIFSGRSTISTRRLLEPRWRHATFIAGLIAGPLLGLSLRQTLKVFVRTCYRMRISVLAITAMGGRSPSSSPTS